MALSQVMWSGKSIMSANFMPCFFIHLSLTSLPSLCPWYCSLSYRFPPLFFSPSPFLLLFPLSPSLSLSRSLASPYFSSISISLPPLSISQSFTLHFVLPSIARLPSEISLIHTDSTRDFLPFAMKHARRTFWEYICCHKSPNEN